MALIVEHFKQKGVPKVYIYSDKQMYIAKGDDMYWDAIDLEGEEVHYAETDIPLPIPEPETQPVTQPEGENEGDE